MKNVVTFFVILFCTSCAMAQVQPIRNPAISGTGSIINGATLTNNGTFTNSGTLGGAGTFDLSLGTVTMPATQILTNVTLNGTITFADNIKQTFNPGATYVGINVGVYAGVPSTLANGDIWYDSTANALKARINGATVSLGAGGGGSSTLDTLTDVNLTSLADVDFLRYDSGTSKWINRTPANVRTDLSLGAAALLGTSTGGNGTADNGKVLIFDTGGHFHATTSISVNNTSGTITAQFRPDSLLLNSTGSGSHTINGSATGARSHTLLDESGTLAHTATTLAGYGITDAQPLDATLTALAALNNTKGVLGQTGSDTFTRLQTPVNVKVYGAAGDARKVTDAVLNGTTTVTSATAAFTSADTGKVVWGIETSSGAARLPVGTATYVNSTTITCSVSATGSYTGIHLVIGTDDTAEIQAAATAADAMSPKGQVYIPGGGYVFSDRLFNQTYASGTPTYSIQGDGSFETILYPSPDHAASGGVILNTNSNATHGNMVGLQIDGSSASFTGVSFVSEATNKCLWIDMRLTNFKGISNITRVTSSDSRFYNCHWEGSSYVGVLVSGYADFYGCYTGNHGFYGLHLSTGRAHWFGGMIDESGTASVQNDVGVFKVSNSIVYAGANYISTVLTGASLMYADNTEFVPFSSNNNCTGISLEATSTAWVTNCKFTGSGTGYGINNSGTVHDGGGNTIGSLTGTVLADGANSIRSVAHGGTGLASGTSGGVLYYSTIGTLASSGALAANAIVIGGGAGTAPSTTTTGTGVLTALGNATGGAGGLVTYSGAIGAATATTASVSDNDTSVATTAFVQGERAIVTKSTAASYTIGTTDSRELYGGVIYVTGAATITIPAVASGASFTVITVGAVAVSVDPNASDLIYLNGTALADGDKITNASTTGDMAVFTYYDGTGWYANTNSGWTDGN